LLSLDAPTVAVLWAWSFARAAQIHAPTAAIAVLGVGTWLIYVADRLLDVRSPGNSALRERHFFHERHRRVFLVAAPVVTALLLGLIAVMPAAARRDDTILFAASMLYFAGVHLPALRVRRWFPREVAVGVLFALATAVPAWSEEGSPHAQIGWWALLFAGLCILNCIAIETWERSTTSTRSVTVPANALCVAVAAVALLVAHGTAVSGRTGLFFASLVSAVVLFALDRLYRRSFKLTDPANRTCFLLGLRVAADAALLTPIFFLFPWHL
jgi:hypothetical protein